METYRVGLGESPATIARRFGVGVGALLQANPHKPVANGTWRSLGVGEILYVPVGVSDAPSDASAAAAAPAPSDAAAAVPAMPAMPAPTAAVVHKHWSPLAIAGLVGAVAVTGGVIYVATRKKGGKRRRS